MILGIFIGIVIGICICIGAGFIAGWQELESKHYKGTEIGKHLSDLEFDKKYYQNKRNQNERRTIS